MNYISKKILKKEFSWLGIFLGMVATVVWLSQSVSIFSAIDNLGLPRYYFFYYSVIFTVNAVNFALPLVCPIVIMQVYRHADKNNYLIGMRTLGMTPLQIVKPALLFSMYFGIGSFFLIGIAGPFSIKETQNMTLKVNSESIQEYLKPNLFNPINDNLMIYISNKDEEGYLRQIFVQDTSKQDVTVTYTANRGKVTLDPKTRKIAIEMENGTLQEVNLQKRMAQSVKFKQYSLSIEKDILGTSKALIPQLSWIDLVHGLIYNLTDNKKEKNKDKKSGQEELYKSFPTWKILLEIQRRFMEPLILIGTSLIVILCFTQIKASHAPLLHIVPYTVISIAYGFAVILPSRAMIIDDQFHLISLLLYYLATIIPYVIFYYRGILLNKPKRKKKANV